tara:strand:- start:1313 stop:1999 length:687 start_codon:yes stop_codon:yes gene_type:complete
MRGKKGDIGSFMTWLVAFTIIFFLLGLFLLGVTGLATQVSKNSIEINEQKFRTDPISSLEFYPDSFRTKSLMNFFKIHEEEIFDWVDDENFLTSGDRQGMQRETQNLGDFPITEEDKERILGKQEVLRGIFENYFLEERVKKPVLYLYSGKKRFVLMENSREELIAVNPRVPYPDKDVVPLEDVVIAVNDEGRVIHVRFLMLSEKGNLLGVNYFDESDGNPEFTVGGM